MTCNRDKNSVKGKDVHWGIPLHAELWGGSLENDLQSWQELYAREGMHWWLLLHVGLWGGKFRKWLAMVTRTLCKGRICIEEYHCMQGFGGGGVYKKTCNREKNSMQGKDVHWGIPSYAELWGGKFRKWLAMVTRTLCKGRMRIQKYHCMQSFSGGKFRKWLAILTRTLWKGRMCIEEYHCMQSFGGGEFIKMTCNREKNSMQGKDVHWGLPLHAELWGGKFRKWLAIVTRTLWKGRMCIEDYHCMQSFGGGEV